LVDRLGLDEAVVLELPVVVMLFPEGTGGDGGEEVVVVVLLPDVVELDPLVVVVVLPEGEVVVVAVLLFPPMTGGGVTLVVPAVDVVVPLLRDPLIVDSPEGPPDPVVELLPEAVVAGPVVDDVLDELPDPAEVEVTFASTGKLVTVKAVHPFIIPSPPLTKFASPQA
jgi:hypothetical protein